MRLSFLLLWLMFIPALAYSGTLRGRVTDENGQGLPFASIYIKETSSGTATNDRGDYLLQLPQGTYTVEFKFVGYKATLKTVAITEAAQELNVQLTPEVLNLQEVVVRAADEDAAYPIMRAAIRLRKYHLEEAKAWSSRVYMKSVARMDKVPGKVLGVKVVDVDTGIVYLSESVSELHFKRPNKINERVISSKVSGKKQGFSFNQASEMNISFYESLMKVEGLSERGFVSPLANNALFFYRYEYLGAFQENGRIINKIKVIPKRKNDPVFQGNIYIVDGMWRIHSTNLMLTKNAGIDFVDFIRVQQVYAPVQEHVWMPVSQKFNFEGSGLGFKGRGYVTGVYSNYRVQPAYSKPPVLEEVEPEPSAPAVVEAKPKAQARRKQRPVLVKPEQATPEEVAPIHSEKLFTKEILVVEREANTRDSAYWDEIRPVPLTQEELQDYQKKDTLEAIKNSRVYQDSLDRIRNKPTIASFLRGYTYYNSYEKRFLTINPLLSITGGSSALQYNTVEGAVLNVAARYTRRLDDRRNYQLEPAVRYGFANQRFNAKLRASYTYDPLKRSTIAVEGGRFVDQINNLNPISPIVNTAYTLLWHRNYMKLYQRDYAQVNYSSELLNGLYLNTFVNYANRMPLQNSTDFTFRERPNTTGFTSNVPVNAELGDASFEQNQALTASITLSYRPGQTYISRPDRKINLLTKWPTFSVAYRTGIKGVLGSDVQYNTAAARITDDMDLGLLGTSNYSVQGGIFWGKENMTIVDYKHFNGNRTIFAGTYEGFQLLDYYRYSTNNSYLEGHFEHHFNGFLFNKIPLFRRLKWQEVAGLHYLNTQQSENYLELNLGIEHIFKVVRVDFVTSFQEQQRVRSGIRIGVGF